MLTEAVKEGFYETSFGRFPKLQILTIQQLLEGQQPHMPWADPDTFKKDRKTFSLRCPECKKLSIFHKSDFEGKDTIHFQCACGCTRDVPNQMTSSQPKDLT